MTTIFLDTSAFCKAFTKTENGNNEARKILEGYKKNGDSLVSSKLLDIEIARFVNRGKNGGTVNSGMSSEMRKEVNLFYRSYQVMLSKEMIRLHDIDDEVIKTAKHEFTPYLKSLDAIHAATMYLKYPNGILFSHDGALRKTCEEVFGMNVCPPF